MIEITDIRGVRLRFPVPPCRLLSLVPSLTETLADLGRRDLIVGCTSFCVRPVGLIDKLAPSGGVVGGTKEPDIDAVRALKPDLVLANREENRREDIESIETFCPVHVSEPGSVNDVLNLLADLGLLLKAEGEARGWAERIERERAELNRLRDESRPWRFGYLVWWRPAMIAGGDTYISRLLEEGPFVNAFTELRRYPMISEEELSEAETDFLFAPSEPYDFDGAPLAEVKRVAGRARVERIDGRMCSWHGTRTALALAYLRKLTGRLANR